MGDSENAPEEGVPTGDSQDSTWSIYQQHKRKLVQLANTRRRLKEVNQKNKAQDAEIRKLNKQIRELEKKLNVKVVDEAEPEGQAAAEAPAEAPVHREKGFSFLPWDW